MIKKRNALFKSFNLSLFTSLVCLDAPALLTASTRSVTLGSIFQFYLGLTNLLSCLLQSLMIYSSLANACFFQELENFWHTLLSYKLV